MSIFDEIPYQVRDKFFVQDWPQMTVSILLNNYKKLGKKFMTKWWVLLATTLLMVTLNVDLTAVNLAVAYIANDLHTGISTAQWIINGPTMACAALTAVAGRFGDMFGHRKIFLFGAIVFLITSLVCGLAINSWTIVLPRIAQGIGIAFSLPMIYVLNFKIFPETQRGFALGILASAVGLAQAIGPSLGGFLIQFLSWRWIFLVNIPIVLFACLIILLKYRDSMNKNAGKIDLVGIALLASALLSLLFGLNQGHNWGLFSITFISCLLISFCLFVIFVYYETHISQPLLNLELLKNKIFLSVNLIRLLYNYVFFTLLFLSGLLLINIFEFSATKAGFYLLFMTVIFGLVSTFSGRWVDRVGTRLPIVSSMLLLIIACFIFIYFGFTANHLTLLAGLFFAGLASGIILPSSSFAAMSAVSKEKTGQATGIFYTNMFLGSTLGVAISGFVLSFVSHQIVIKLLSLNKFSLNAISLQQMFLAASGVNTVATLQSHANATELQTIAKSAYLQAFSVCLWICLALSCLALLLSFTLKSKENF